MIKTGVTQKLYVNRFSEYGVYLSDTQNGDNEVLLPNKYVKPEMDVDDLVEVFVHRDSEERLVATTKASLIELGGIASLKVIGEIKGGFFLDMGLDKDLFLPFSETKVEVKKGRKVLVKLLVDDADKLYASMKIYNHLEDGAHFKVGDQVEGTVVEVKPPFGAFVAVDNRYHGLIPMHEMYNEIKEGAHFSGRVTRVKEDGKVNISVRDKAAVQIDADVAAVLDALETSDGVLYLNDHSDPDIIKKRLNLSKRAFKRAVGRLLKEEKIVLTDEGIELKA